MHVHGFCQSIKPMHHAWVGKLLLQQKHLIMADANIEVYAVVDKSKKNHKSFMLLPNDETAETDSPPPIPERSEALESEYSMLTADTAVDPGTEKKEGAVLKSVGATAMPVGPAEEFDNTYSTITVRQPANPEKKGEGVKSDADSKPTPEGTLQHLMTTAPAKSSRSFYSEYSMITLDNVHSTVNDGDLPSQQPAETDMGTGKVVTKAAAAGKENLVNGKCSHCKAALVCVLVLIVVASIAALGACIAFLFLKVVNLEAEIASHQPMQQPTQDSSIMEQLQKFNESISRINNSTNHCLNMTLSLDVLKHELSELDRTQATHTQQLNTSLHMLYEQLNLNTDQLNSSIETISGDITAIENKTQLLIDYFQIGQSEENPSPSCAALRGLSPSGYYWVRTSNGSAVHVYCDMTRSCGGVTGGWVRVANIQPHMTNECPEDLDYHIEKSEHTCRRDSPLAGCSGVQFYTHLLNYSTVCGRIQGLIFGAINGFVRTSNTDIDGNYVDGVSLTHGTPREHIWTFAATSTEQSTCSCNNSIPLSVRNDYFCDTRLRGQNTVAVWEGTDCDGCCSFNNPPWFYKQLPQPTTDDIEMRVCRDEDRRSEDVFIQIAEVYIQ